MELRRTSNGNHLGLTRRFVAWVYSWHLDQELAAGVDPASDPLLAHRARQLSAPATRHQIAQSLRDLVETAERPHRSSASATVARASVRAERAHLLELARRLDSEEGMGLTGIASANLLLTDGASPLWARTEPRELHHAVDSALSGPGR